MTRTPRRSPPRSPRRAPKAALFAAVTAALAACATPAVYAPAARPGAAGYSELKIENDRYRVTYADAPNEAAAADFALLRAADVTLAQGYDWFVVDQRSTDRAGAPGGPRISIGGGTASYGGRSSVGVGAGVGFNLGGGPKSTVALEIRLGRGPKPDNANAYDARQVQSTVRARL
ncbi:MAG: hypothetical protein NW200_02975 [Hyphomonadaceae bacterium]|nr:hypothetical protein [Hyphomonadaceae bacterium]